MKTLDLADLLDNKPHTPKLRDAAITLDDLLPQRKHGLRPFEVVLFWNTWICNCGKVYETPTYGQTLTNHKLFNYGRFKGNIYKPYIQIEHITLPRRMETIQTNLQHCPACIFKTPAETFQIPLEWTTPSNDEAPREETKETTPECEHSYE